MNNYFSQIVNRVNRSRETPSLKPNVPGRTSTTDVHGQGNPFEGDVEKATNPFEQTAELNQHNKITPDFVDDWNIQPQKEHMTSTGDESSDVSPTSERPVETEIKTRKVKFNSEQSSPVTPVSGIIRSTRRKTGDMQSDVSTRGQITRQEDKPLMKPAKQPDVNTVTEKNTISGREKEQLVPHNVQIPDLKPMELSKSITPSSQKKNTVERKLVIGSLKVEVVMPQPAAKQQVVFQAPPQKPKQNTRNVGYASSNKIRFGLGQL